MQILGKRNLRMILLLCFLYPFCPDAPVQDILKCLLLASFRQRSSYGRIGDKDRLPFSYLSCIHEYFPAFSQLQFHSQCDCRNSLSALQKIFPVSQNHLSIRVNSQVLYHILIRGMMFLFPNVSDTIP